MNQAAIKASVDGLKHVDMGAFEYAKDKLMMGVERKSAIISEDTMRCTAFHEGEYIEYVDAIAGFALSSNTFSCHSIAIHHTINTLTLYFYDIHAYTHTQLATPWSPSRPQARTPSTRPQSCPGGERWGW